MQISRGNEHGIKRLNLSTTSTTQSYDILVGKDLLAQIGGFIRDINKGKKALIVTDSNVVNLYEKTVRKSLVQAGFDVSCFVFKAGEQSKNLGVVHEIYERMAFENLTRNDIVVALGGGVTGDMAGYAAATWLRGIDFVQIPTTLLAQVDSSVGGKTGVDIPSGKNLVGAFWQPRLVVVDVDTLKTLTAEIYADGMAEIIKAALIKDYDFFQYLKGDIDTISMILRSIDIKRKVVEADFREVGERKLLNFGHTLGHAIEKHYDFKFSHGKAVAVGMVWVTKAAENAGISPRGTADEIAELCLKYNLPVDDNTPIKDILTYISHDKKRTNCGVDFVFIEEIGRGSVRNISLMEVDSFFDLK